MPGKSKDTANNQQETRFGSILLETAKKHGFPLAGALDLDLVQIQSDVHHYDQWLAAGYSGAMSYLVRGRDRRADPRLVFPEAQSILSVGQPYSAQPAGHLQPEVGPRYARYLRSTDYHEDIAERLEQLMQEVASQWSLPLQWKVCVDTSAVLERSWAALAGLGWVGKNTMLIHPQYGSYFFLGEVLISEKTGRGPTLLPNYCGNCTRCLDACPAQAFPLPRVLNATRCISYLTLEKRGEFGVPDEHKAKMGTWIAGCDICQEVCPFNTKVSKNSLTAEDQAISLNRWKELLEEDEQHYRARVKESSLSRVKPAQFSRNLANALCNALSAIKGTISQGLLLELTPLIQYRFENETDPLVKQEWSRCLAQLLESE